MGDGRNPTILVVDDEASSRLNIRDVLSGEGYEVDEAENGEVGLERMADKEYDAVLLDIRMPVMDGFEALRQIREQHPDLPVVIFTAYGSSEKAIEAMKIGAFDYITKPFDIEELITTIRRAAEYKYLTQEVRALRSRLAEVEAAEFQPDKFVSSSAAMQKVFKLIGRVAPSDSTVLIEGETGTGKELVANAIWYHSRRRERAFIKVNCAAIPETLLESELFGHEKGAFTDAHAQRKGHFEFADGGTLFLDEIGEMSPGVQSKVLRVLEQQEFQRVGGSRTLRTDVRILAATNRNLETEMQTGRFRKDLYFRLQVVRLTLPPLRERMEDIPQLARYFVSKYAGGRRLMLSDDALEELHSYSWPGNVRELENVIERATIVTQGTIISKEHVSPGRHDVSPSGGQASGQGFSLRDAVARTEREVILQALNHTGWNRTEASLLLGIDRRHLFNKIKALGLDPPKDGYS